MADDKRGRDKQAHDEERRQRERDLETALERGDEAEPPIPATELGELEDELETLSFPTTAADVVETVGDREIESPDGTYRLEELLPETDAEIFDSPAAVSVQVQRPTVAAAMKRIIEASDVLQDADFGGSRRDAYKKTLEALAAIEADDDDEGIDVITDWIVERIDEKGKLPGSRAVRREAAKFCRSNGYEVRVDEWLGI
ncbi:hypothetical protein HLRTI_002938 [Halorhabdus tiamatea SARL4B]|uniref:Uncharacterized protein n=1 Tax=Halorhabdus tiamatea SARL4B TaxID=1033806 RepID=F7PNB5_9EURY|nr:DUF5789 family protein [Halorhabdus tiamatea]ERJ05066.1 hypothetical protein HLRTI_002938 [Halorhabdus tiamatea SARL4B]CCQ34588.1 conserved hypothetical protein [Halorhabdus tiamatea SARL4B]